MEKTREAFEAAESELDRLNSELDTVNEELKFDYGKNREWLKLKDVCISKDEGE
jgi:protein kinase C substrate 80K-H